jgi:hypothetical protein
MVAFWPCGKRSKSRTARHRYCSQTERITSAIEDLAETIAAAQRARVSIYTIATHNPNQCRRGGGVLQPIASDTGGRDFVVKK